MTLTAAKALLEPGWRIVRQGTRYALLWQSQRARGSIRSWPWVRYGRWWKPTTI